MAITLRAASERDVPDLRAIESESFPAPNWPEETFLKFDCTVAEVEGKLIGFIVYRQISAGYEGAEPEHEILNLAVSLPYRRLAVASQLLDFVLGKPGTFFLEVRKSNAAALQLYEKLGFKELYRRENYYDNPCETAIVMRRK